jgi:L-threonylcarbamoyladenylate synthase
LVWDLGETRGTVALRMPNNRVALEILSETGPLAVSSANLTGEPAAMTAEEAEAMLRDSVAVYLEAGRAGGNYVTSNAEPGAELGAEPGAEPGTDRGAAPLASTIVDATALLLPEGKLRIVRQGVISDEAIREIVGDRCA